jgi:methylated-DNA-[protein]-cysteine S-methyltransferase
MEPARSRRAYDVAQRFTYEIDGWGTGELWLEGHVLAWHELPRPLGAPHPTTRCQRNEKGVTRGKRNRVESESAGLLIERITAFFAGENVSFGDVQLDLDWCTPFQDDVTRTLRAVPRGEVVTYGELAALAGYPNAQRAAGTYCAHNRAPLVVPCHRVVAASGLGSYGSLGLAFKRRLLELEGVSL